MTARQSTLFSGEDGRPQEVAPTPRFDGDDYQPDRDDVRLSGQIKRIWDAMIDGHWRTLPEIESITGDPPASISAQLRHLRKKRFGGHTVNREYVENGLYRYQLVPRETRDETDSPLTF